jgi:hypothetical protein
MSDSLAMKIGDAAEDLPKTTFDLGRTHTTKGRRG